MNLRTEKRPSVSDLVNATKNGLKKATKGIDNVEKLHLGEQGKEELKAYADARRGAGRGREHGHGHGQRLGPRHGDRMDMFDPWFGIGRM